MRYIFYGCVLLPSYLQTSASHIEKYIHKYNFDEYKKETNQQITTLQKENAELKTRLAYLEEKMDSVMSQFIAAIKTQTSYPEAELP
jgi:cell division protein FtsB